jgi:hypothetical protein
LFDLVRQEAARSRRQFKDVLNERLRQGFSAGEGKRPKGKKFKVNPYGSGGFAPGVDEKKLNQLYDTLEIETRKR